MAQDYPSAWKNIEQLQQKGQYRSALEATSRLYQSAQNEGKTDESLKALFYRAAFTQELEENGSEAAIELLKTELAASSKPLFQAVVHHALGRAYLSYAEQTAYKEQTATEILDPTLPLAEWPLLLTIRTGSQHLLTGLELAASLKTPLEAIPAIVSPGENLSLVLPTLYDLLVHNSLKLLNQGYAYLPEPTFVFRPEPKLLLLEPTAFVNQTFSAQDTSGLQYRSLLVYQQLLGQHPEPTNSAYVYANLERLAWAYAQGASVEDYAAALTRLFSLAKKLLTPV
ncbi:MAG: hypothetical protein HC821_05500, partial [Lewinella sp.]|nr:hypothetical protein [Lewinella sp.]